MEETKCSVGLLLAVIGVQRQAYYKWLKRKNTPNDVQDSVLAKKILALEEKHHYSLGTRTLAVYLNRDGDVKKAMHHKVGRKRIARLMSEHEISCKIRIKKHDWQKRQEKVISENLVNRKFYENDIPDDLWLTDFTDLTYGEPGRETHVRLSGVLDVHTGFLVAYNLSSTETREAAIKTLEIALKRAGNVQPMVHSDRGSAYTAHKYEEFLDKHNMKHSMSRPGTPYDNSPMERWWNELKTNWIATHSQPKTLTQLKRLIMKAVHYFNYERRTTKRNEETPAEYREQQLKKYEVA